MVADSIKHMLHAGVSAFILGRRLGGLAEHGVGRTLVLAVLASAAMGLLAFGMLTLTQSLLPGRGLGAEMVAVAGPGLVGGVVYLALLSAFRIEEIQVVWHLLRRRLGYRAKL